MSVPRICACACACAPYQQFWNPLPFLWESCFWKKFIFIFNLLLLTIPSWWLSKFLVGTVLCYSVLGAKILFDEKYMTHVGLLFVKIMTWQLFKIWSYFPVCWRQVMKYCTWNLLWRYFMNISKHFVVLLTFLCPCWKVRTLWWHEIEVMLHGFWYTVVS